MQFSGAALMIPVLLLVWGPSREFGRGVGVPGLRVLACSLSRRRAPVGHDDIHDRCAAGGRGLLSRATFFIIKGHVFS